MESGLVDGVKNLNESHPESRRRKVDPLWTGLLKRIDEINTAIANRGKVSEKSMYFYRPERIIPEIDTDSESNMDEHEMALIDVSRFSVISEEDGVTSDAAVNVTDEASKNEPNDEVHSIPELEPGHPETDDEDVPVDLIDQLDEIELGKSQKYA